MTTPLSCTFDMVVIGFGKGGKTAGAYAKTGKNVAVIEQSTGMYGGTCINIGCVPTKAFRAPCRRVPVPAVSVP